MGKWPNLLRYTISGNIRDCRIKVYGGRGGARKAAQSFSTFIRRAARALPSSPEKTARKNYTCSPQQWSPWERGGRTPDESRLQEIADFFRVTVEYLRKRHNGVLYRDVDPTTDKVLDTHSIHEDNLSSNHSESAAYLNTEESIAQNQPFFHTAAGSPAGVQFLASGKFWIRPDKIKEIRNWLNQIFANQLTDEDIERALNWLAMTAESRQCRIDANMPDLRSAKAGTSR